VPTIQEQGVDTPMMKAANWAGLVGPKGMPDALVKRWIDLLNEVVRSPEFEKFLAGSGQALVARTGQDFGRDIASEFAATNDMMRDLGVKPQ
jgi:tripartite-type tricarboxylate transporter receptor subunit TctC